MRAVVGHILGALCLLCAFTAHGQSNPGLKFPLAPHRPPERRPAPAKADPPPATVPPANPVTDADAKKPAYPYDLRPAPAPLGGPSPYAPYLGDVGEPFDEGLRRALSIGADSESLLRTDWTSDMRDFSSVEEITISGSPDDPIVLDKPVQFRFGDTEVRADRAELSIDPLDLTLEGNVHLQRGGSTLEAESIRISDPADAWPEGPHPLTPLSKSRGVPHPLLPAGKTAEDYAPPVSRGRIEMTGVDWNEQGLRALTADSLTLDLRAQTATATNANGHAGPLYFYADELRIRGAGNVVLDDLWVTTCDEPVPHYKLRLSRAELQNNRRIVGTNARLQLGKVTTPVYFPRVATALYGDERVGATELEIGGSADLGLYLNAAQWFRATEHSSLAPRIYPTTQQGFGMGLDGRYNLMNAPGSVFYRSAGEYQTLWTTNDRGYAQAYHRQELTLNTVALAQGEYWSDSDFVKDYFNSEFNNRTGPRSFLNLTRTRPEYIVTATVSPSTNSFTTETEKSPELTFHLLERQATGNLYGTFDTLTGYYITEPSTVESFRTLSIGRLSYDWNAAQGLNVMPFVEVDGTYYSRTLDGDGDALRGSGTAGVTLQARLQRGYDGMRQFSGFKHIVIPSTTLLYRPAATVSADETPRFDDLDDRPARFRIENTIDNIILGRNASTEQTWAVGRVTFYHGHDFYNERAVSSDYELEIEVRPRPWWGIQTIGEIHNVEDGDVDAGEDFNRVLSYLFFDNEAGEGNLNGRIGFAYTDAAGDVINEEVLYGGGYRISENWSAGFEHRFDVDRGELSRQSYSLRRRLHKWEMEFVVRKRERGVDIGVGFNLTDFRHLGIGF